MINKAVGNAQSSTQALWSGRSGHTARRGLLALLACVAGLGWAPQVFAAKSRDYGQYAKSSYSAMQTYLYTANNLYRETYPAQGGNPYSYNWPFTRAMDGTADMTGLPTSGSTYTTAIDDRIVGASRYWDATPTFGLVGADSYVVAPWGNGGDKYYDDNAWEGLNLLRAYRMDSTRTGALASAKQIFSLIDAGWDTSSSCATGGVYWKQQTPTETNHDRNTVSTAPAAVLGFRLYELTGNMTYYNEAAKMYDWVTAKLSDSDGLFWDHYRGDCSIDKTKWSYNQGSMIGANLLRYRITSDVTYLTLAERIARAALNYYTTVGYSGQGAPFNAIFFRNLLYLKGYTKDTTLQNTIRSTIENYANQIWDNTTIHQRSNLFYFQSGFARLLDQGAMVQIYAMLAWSPTSYELLV